MKMFHLHNIPRWARILRIVFRRLVPRMTMKDQIELQQW